jgi:hypothetical protein
MIDENIKKLFKDVAKSSKSLSKTISNTASAITNKEKIISDKLEANRRLQLCNACPNLIKESGRCDICGCFVSLKVKIAHEECPIEKW